MAYVVCAAGSRKLSKGAARGCGYLRRMLSRAVRTCEGLLLQDVNQPDSKRADAWPALFKEKVFHFMGCSKTICIGGFTMDILSWVPNSVLPNFNKNFSFFCAVSPNLVVCACAADYIASGAGTGGWNRASNSSRVIFSFCIRSCALASSTWMFFSMISRACL